MTAFGDFSPSCTNTPSYTWCNLFCNQLKRTTPSLLTGLSNSSTIAPVGVNPVYGISPIFSSVGSTPHLGSIANIITCGVLFLFILGLIFLAHRHKTAVGRIEIRALLALYALSLPLRLLTTVVRQKLNPLYWYSPHEQLWYWLAYHSVFKHTSKLGHKIPGILLHTYGLYTYRIRFPKYLSNWRSRF